MSNINKNGYPWTDDEGNLIQAHGGDIIESKGVYYWYGENKGVPNINSANQVGQVPFVGISCYQSTDLKSWHFVDNVLTMDSDSQGRIQPNSIIERPKVMYNKKTDKYVMWTHFDNAEYNFAGCLVATSDGPNKPFTVADIFRPNRKESRDLTLFRDNNDVFLVHSSDMNMTLYFSKLTDDYLSCTGFYTKVLVDQEREAPAIIHEGNWYFILTSGATGWQPNPALFSRSKFLYSGQKIKDNPCVGSMKNITYGGQPTTFFRVNGRVFLLLDHWYEHHLSQSGYSILPVQFTGPQKDELMIPWVEEPFGGA